VVALGLKHSFFLSPWSAESMGMHTMLVFLWIFNNKPLALSLCFLLDIKPIMGLLMVVFSDLSTVPGA
jgi:hypothetical protein